MTGLMEILKVESVIPYLIQIISFESDFPDFEFKYKDNSAAYQYRIYTASDARDDKLKKNVSGSCGEACLQDFDLLQPSVPLGNVNGKGGLRCKLP